jgi:hypothetical protein
MSNIQYRVEIFPDESSMFKMNSETAKPIIDCIKNLKVFARFTFGEVPSHELRIMGIGQIPHTWRNMFLQYNTRSGRYRILVEAPSHQVPSELELTMQSNNNRSQLTKQQLPRVQTMLRFITDDAFWRELNASHNACQQILSDFSRKYPRMNHAGGSKNKKSVKKNTKSIY